MSRNESESSSDDDNSIPIPGLVSRDHVSSSDESDAADDKNAPNHDNGYNSSESESESSIPVLIDRAVSDSSDDSGSFWQCKTCQCSSAASSKTPIWCRSSTSSQHDVYTLIVL